MRKPSFESIAIKDVTIDNFTHVLPIYASSTFVYESPEKVRNVFEGNAAAYIYSRWNNPTVEKVEQKLAALENYDAEDEAACLLFSSGMAAISAVMVACLSPGEAIITQGNLYGTSTELLNHLGKEKGIEVFYTDLSDLAAFSEQLTAQDNCKLVYIESPSNPTINVYDIRKISEIAHSAGVIVAIDNTFASPYLQRPLHFGADIVVYSATKFLNGHGTVLSGAVISKDIEFMKNKVWNVRKLYGGTCSPFDAWLLNNGLKTLALRMDKHCSNSLELARRLTSHKAVGTVNYLGLSDHRDHAIAKKQMSQFGGVLSFELKGGIEAGTRLMESIRFCTLTATLGTPDTLISHPASMTHIKVDKAQRLANGITDGLIRISVGLENVEDIWSDLKQAMAAL